MNRNAGIRGFRVSSLLLGSLIACIATAAAWAQATSDGTISGLVTDPQNAAIAGADVKIVDPTTNTSRLTSTNGVGRYTFINVEPGIYNLSVSHPGFTQAKIQGQKVDVGSALILNVTLEVGATTVVLEIGRAS